MRIQKQLVGREQAPLLIIDEVVADPDELVEYAAAQTFSVQGRYYPGIRCVAPERYQRFLLTALHGAFLDCLGAANGILQLSMCHYSLVTTPPQDLAPLQRIPHVDSLQKQGLATIHYLFRSALGGTAFYRHRRTGFESLDESRNPMYARTLQAETVPAARYINGDTELFEQIGRGEAAFNRMLVYPRNLLHSGCIPPDFVPDANPRSGRLSINSFIDLAPA